jgi:hypothetical protein
MGGIGQFALSQMSPDQIAAMQQQLASATPITSDSTQTQVQPQTPPASTGYSSDIANPSDMPINSPNAPGSLGDLENLRLQAPLQTAQNNFQQQQPQPGQQSYSPENPHAKLAQYYTQQLMQAQPPAQGGNVKKLLTNFFSGMGASMMHEAGLQTPDERGQILARNAATYGQLANQWEEAQNLAKYRAALTDQLQQSTAFNVQMQPLRLQQEQQGIAAGQQAIPSVQPTMSAEDLTALGVPSDLATQYEGKPLTAADMGSLRQMAVAGQKQLFDYGQDGQGPNRGIWLMSKNYEPIKQIATVSETGRSVAAAKIQAQAQNNLIKSAGAPVYAYDPTSKQTVLTTTGDARNGGMQAIRGVKETDIRNDMHDTRVLNDVAVKSNNLMDSSAALDQSQNQRDMINWAMSQAEKDNQFKVGAFGTTFPTGWFNGLLNSSNMSGATQLTKDYVVSVLSLREAAMGMQKVLTGSARANESQIAALQATVPGLETNSALARQKLAAFTQNVDMLRQGLPRMPGIDVIPVRPWNGKQGGQVNELETNPTSSTGRSNLQLF